jgi:uncharacterized Zn-binding protein involved in type VI secretion
MVGQLSRVGDLNNKGGKLVRGAKTVMVEGIPCALHVSPILPHPAGPKHKAAVTITASPSVFCEGVPVIRTGSKDSCGDTTIQGSLTVNVP